MAPTGTQMLLKSLGLDPEKMLADFKAFADTMAAAKTLLQEIKDLQVEGNSTLRDNRADIEDLSARFTALESAFSTVRLNDGAMNGRPDDHTTAVDDTAAVDHNGNHFDAATLHAGGSGPGIGGVEIPRISAEQRSTGDLDARG